jgi:hypothetical protein
LRENFPAALLKEPTEAAAGGVAWLIVEELTLFRINSTIRMLSFATWDIDVTTKDFTIYDFSKAVKIEIPNLLNHVVAMQLNVYPPGTAVPVPVGTDPCDPRSRVSDHFVADEDTFIVVAPSQQMNANGELFCMF